MDGWCKKLLRIDLADRTHSVEKIPDTLLNSYIGGVGLATYYLYASDSKRIDPFSSNNPIIFATGPLAGTGIGSSGRFCVACVSPLTNYFLQSHSGGHFGSEIKYAGYDCIVIEGKSDTPCYIVIEDDYVDIRNAGDIWGKGVKTTTRYLEENADPESKIASIGPAGESLSCISTIQNDVYRSCGRGGAGAVMGSKNLKAIAVRGSCGVDVKNPEAVLDHIRSLKDISRRKAKPFSDYGTPNAGILTSGAGIMPTKNFTSGTFENIESIVGTAMKDTIWKGRRACFSCPIGCSQLSVNGGIRTEGPEYETTFSLGSNILNGDLDTLVEANELCNDMGLDTISAGVTISWYMEACEKGMISSAPNWGDGATIIHLLRQMATRNGEGELLCDGVKRASDKKGGASFAIHVKGMELPGYDPRGTQGMALAYATSSRGACHLRAPMYVSEIFTRKLPAKTLENKVRPLIELENILAIMDCLIMCRFGSRTLIDQGYGAALSLLDIVTGKKFEENDLINTAERIWSLQRLFNLRQGMECSEDSLPDRFFSESLDGVSLDRTLFTKAISEYYVKRGWDVNGIPTESTCSSLGINLL